MGHHNNEDLWVPHFEQGAVVTAGSLNQIVLAQADEHAISEVSGFPGQHHGTSEQ